MAGCEGATAAGGGTNAGAATGAGATTAGGGTVATGLTMAPPLTTPLPGGLFRKNLCCGSTGLGSRPLSPGDPVDEK